MMAKFQFKKAQEDRNNMYQLKYLIVLVIGLMSLSPSLFAYSKSNHELITSEAAQVLGKCGYENIFSGTDLDTLIDYNKGQDKLLKKAMLWHFPMPAPGSDNAAPSKERAIGYGKIVEDTTFNNWVRYLENQATQQESFKKRIPAIGAILHYLQDIIVPAHAVPIFHPTGIATKDKFDDWDTFNYQQEFQGKKLQLFCNQLKTSEIANVDELLITTRRNTIQKLKSNFLNGQSWELIWPTKIVNHGFGHYGCSKKDVFGKKQFKCNGDQYSTTEDIYTEFASERITDAIKSSAILIKHFIKVKPGIKHKCDEGQWLPNRTLLKCLKDSK